MKNLSSDEKKVLEIITDTCEDIDGELFTRFSDFASELFVNIDEAKNYMDCLGSLQYKGFITIDSDVHGIGVWVEHMEDGC